jgi:hypothetical protein
MLSIRSVVVGAPTVHSRAITPVRAGISIGTTRVAGFARGLRTVAVARARELRRPSPAAVRARRRSETGAACVVLHGDLVVSRAVAACRAIGAVCVGMLLVGAAAGADGADDGGEEEDGADDHDGHDDALVHALFGGVVAGVKGQVGWEGSSGVECRGAAAVGCVHGTDTALDAAHDSGCHGHVEAGCCGGDVGSRAGNSRIVVARVDRVKVHVCDCVVFGVLVVVERLSVSFRSSEDVLPEYFPIRESRW